MNMQSAPSKKQLPHNITSYDLLKSAAVIIMIIDHIGYYFFLDDLWWRAVGRVGFPVWFFLVGHAKSRDLGWKLWGGAALLLLGNIIAGMPVFPLNALVTIIVIRLVLDGVMRVAGHDYKALIAVSLVLFLLILQSSLFAEYGTQALIMAMLGYMVRHCEGSVLKSGVIVLFLGFAAASFLMLQDYLFGFEQQQFLLMAIGTFLVMGVLLMFRKQEYPRLTARLPKSLAALLRIGGRRTLEIYIVHLMLFKAMGMVVAPERFPLMEWTLFYAERPSEASSEVLPDSPNPQGTRS